MAEGFTRRLVFTAPGRAEVERVALAPPGPGQAVVRGEWSLISTGTEMTAYTGDFPAGVSAWAGYIRYPFYPGYSLVGVVEAAGEGCALSVGERVAVEAAHASLVLVDAPAATTAAGAAGRHDAAAAVAVPPAAGAQDATFQTLARVVLNGLRLAEVALGESVVVLGCGLLGQLAIRFARLAGAMPVAAVDLSRARLERGRQSGADLALCPDDGDPADGLRAANAGRLADVVVDVTGAPASFVAATRLARDMGRVVLLGSPRGPVTVDLHDDVHSRGLRVLGAHASTTPRQETPFTPWTMRRNAELFFALLATGRLGVSDLVSHRFALSDGDRAYALLDADRTRAMGVLIDLGA